MSSIISRARWGAQNQDGYGNRAVGSLEKYLHHSVTAAPSTSATLAQDVAAVRTVERIGQQRFGVGMSYTLLITPSGRIFQGVSTDRISAHSGSGRNTRGVGICLVGNYDTTQPSKAMLDAVVWLLQEGVRRGWWGDPALTEMHRSFRSTACPGRHAASHFDTINRRGRGQSVSGPSTGGSAGSGTTGGSGGGGGSSASGYLRVTGNQVPVRNGAGASNSQIGTVHTGQLICRDSSRDTPNWYGVGSSWFVRKNTATTASADESEGLYVGQWPGRRIPSARSHTWESHWSWVELMARIGYTDSSLSLALQKWLRSFGNLNVGPADGDFGPRSIRALQRFLSNRSHYSGAIDGDRGPMTIGGEIAYLNSQISSLGSKWPQHARAN